LARSFDREHIQEQAASLAVQGEAGPPIKNSNRRI